MTVSAEAASNPSPSRLEQRVFVALAFTAIGFLLFQLLLYGHGRDQGIYTVVARTVLEGGMPYRDAWDFKPPGIFLIYGLARLLFGSAQWGIRVLEATGLLLTTFGLMRLTKRHWGDAGIGLLAGVVNTVVHVQLDFWHTSQPESFGGMITIAALLCVPTFFEVKDKRGWIAAGALFGFAGLLKPPLVGGAAVLALFPAWAAYRASEGEPLASRAKKTLLGVLRPSLLLAAGGAIPIGLCILWFAAKGALGDLYQVLFVFTPHYTKLGWEGSTVAGMLYWAFTEWLQQYGSVPTIGLLLGLGFGARKEERPLVLLSVGIILIHLVGVALQAKFFPYHYGATWPLTAIIAGLGYHRFWHAARRRGAAAMVFAVLFLVFVPFCRTATKDVPGSFLLRTGRRLELALGGLKDQRSLDALASIADVDSIANRAVAELFKKHAPKERPVFVWGFEPEIYNLADRKAATRYIYDVPQRVVWAKEPHRQVLMEDLRKNRPAAIAVERRDVFPFVTGDAIDSADTLLNFYDLNMFIQERYELIESTEKFDVYIERP